MNCFIVRKDIKQVTLKDVRDNFPLPGDYHFRFQFQTAGVSCWLDLSNEKVALPSVEGSIIMKVLRKHWTVH